MWTRFYNCGYRVRTLQSWLKNVDESGWEALRTKKQSGRPRTLTEQQTEEIKASVKEGPEKSGYTVWGGPSLSDFIKTKYGAAYAERGSEPKVMSKPGKDKIAYSGFIIPKTGELVVTKPGWFNYESVIQSLRDFCQAKPCPDGKKYCVILDNAPWHKKAIRLIWKEQLEEYADIREKMECLPLPPYSPDLSPIEQVWRKTRRDKTHNRYFNKLLNLIDVLDDYFAGFFAPNDTLHDNV